MLGVFGDIVVRCQDCIVGREALKNIGVATNLQARNTFRAQ